MWMNEHEVETMQRLIDVEDTPNLAHAAWVLGNLVDWTNRNSDGWPYWQKPSRAANRLMNLLHERDYAIRFGHDRRGRPLEDVSRAEVSRACSPIKTFMTKNGYDLAEVFAE